MKKTTGLTNQHICKGLLLTAVLILSGLSVVKANYISAPKADSVSIEGRWDITIDMAGKKTPSWLEVRHSGNHTLVGFFVGPGGSARPISEIHYNGSKLNFAIPPQWERGSKDLTIEGTVSGDKLTGTMNTVEGKNYNWTAVRAPLLKRSKAPEWGATVTLFDGKTLAGWHPSGATNQWIVESGILKSPKAGSNLITDKTFTDFKLHIEFRYPKESNSGVYLRGRYEIQITDSKGMEPSVDQLGAIYGFLPPSENMAKEPGEWQSYDVTLIGRMVTLAVNGKTVITNQQIPGITGGALDSNEGEPGPLLIQGDHLPIEYRNIKITLPK